MLGLGGFGFWWVFWVGWGLEVVFEVLVGGCSRLCCFWGFGVGLLVCFRVLVCLVLTGILSFCWVLNLFFIFIGCVQLFDIQLVVSGFCCLMFYL